GRMQRDKSPCDAGRLAGHPAGQAVPYGQPAAPLGYVDLVHSDMIHQPGGSKVGLALVRLVFPERCGDEEAGAVTEAVQARVLAIMGSGETSPTMVTIHKALVARLGSRPHGVADHGAVLLDTPYAFQENAADISARSQAYFGRSVELRVEVISEADRS